MTKQRKKDPEWVAARKAVERLVLAKRVVSKQRDALAGEVAKLLASGVSERELSRELGLSRATIRRLLGKGA